MIQITNLWKAYNGNHVLQGLNLTIETGETLVILGPSGVGKSVLLRQIIGLEKPDQGSVCIDGVSICDLNGQELYKTMSQVGMLFQGGALFDSLNVEENIGFYLNQHGDPQTGKKFAPEIVRERVLAALEMVGLNGVSEMMPSDLSGGQRKRVALARLRVYGPKILLYDEPTTGLDPIMAMQINNLILDTQKDLKATSVVVTHDIASAMTVGDRLALHYEGKIAFIGDKESFKKSDHPMIKMFLRDALVT